MSKYIDPAEQIHAETRDQVYLDEVGEVLEWLDRNPDQAPGRTVTMSEYKKAVMDGDSFTERLEMLGIKIIPDPEPTNAEKLPRRTITESELIAAVDETNHEDMNEYQKARALLVHLGYTIPDPEPTNLQRLTQAIRDWEEGRGTDRILARHLNALGVKAPEADDE